MFTGVFTPGLMMILQAYLGENAVWSVVIFTIALLLNGAVTGGYLGNGLDIAPNFSGIYEYLLQIYNININSFHFRHNIWNGQYFVIVWRILIFVHCGKTYK